MWRWSASISAYLGFWLWNSALAAGGVARIGQVQLLQPFATLAIAALLLGEHIDLRMLLFAIAVVAVVALGLRARVGTRTSAGHSAAVLEDSHFDDALESDPRFWERIGRSRNSLDEGRGSRLEDIS
jgi:EamA-like transporter family